MFDIIPYNRNHGASLAENEIEKKYYLEGEGLQFEREGSYSLIYKGIIMCCGGIHEIWKGRAVVWMIFNKEACKGNMVPVIRAFKKVLDERGNSYERLEIYVPAELDFAKRRARLMGFEEEVSLAKKFFSDGKDASIFVRIKKES